MIFTNVAYKPAQNNNCGTLAHLPPPPPKTNPKKQLGALWPPPPPPPLHTHTQRPGHPCTNM